MCGQNGSWTAGAVSCINHCDFFCWIDASANGGSDMRHNAKRVRPKQQYIVKKSQKEADDSASAIYDAIAGTCSQQGL